MSARRPPRPTPPRPTLCAPTSLTPPSWREQQHHLHFNLFPTLSPTLFTVPHWRRTTQHSLTCARAPPHVHTLVHTLVHTRFLRAHARKAGCGGHLKERRHSGTEKHNRRGAPTASARVAERTSWGEPPQRLVPEETLRLGSKCRRGSSSSNCGVTRRTHCRAVEVSWSGTSSDSDHGRARWD